MKKVISFSVAIILLSFAVFIFIVKANDHKECYNTSQTVTSNNGKKQVTTNKHICKEKYNF